MFTLNMKTVKQKTSLDVENNIFKEFQNVEFKKHGDLFPSSLRCLIIGPSNGGKTNVMIDLLEHPNGLKFENIYIYSKSLYQPKYRYLEALFEPLKEIGYYTFRNSDIIHPSEAKPNSPFIFDDVACDKQDIIREYCSMCRHVKDVDPSYLSQSYAKIPKHLIRDNANVLIVFKQDELHLKHIYNDHVGTDMTFDKFKDICSTCWHDKFGFISIFKD